MIKPPKNFPVRDRDMPPDIFKLVWSKKMKMHEKGKHQFSLGRALICVVRDLQKEIEELKQVK